MGCQEQTLSAGSDRAADRVGIFRADGPIASGQRSRCELWPADSTNWQVPGRCRFSLWYYDCQNPVLVCNVGILRIDVMRQSDGALKAAEGALHQVVGAASQASGRAFFTADPKDPAINRDLDVGSLQTGQLDADDGRVSRFPRFACQQRPLREFRQFTPRPCTRFFRLGTRESGQRAIAAGE